MRRRTEVTSGRKTAKPYTKMTTAELREATAEFDREFVADTFGPPNDRQATQLRRAKRKRGRPQTGQGAKTISVTIEKSLLAETDRLAKRLHASRSALIARGLQAVLAGEASHRP